MWRCSTLQCSTHSDIFAAFLGGRMIRNTRRPLGGCSPLPPGQQPLIPCVVAVIRSPCVVGWRVTVSWCRAVVAVSRCVAVAVGRRIAVGRIAVAISVRGIRVIGPCERASDERAKGEAAERRAPPAPPPPGIRRGGRGNCRDGDGGRRGESGQRFPHGVTSMSSPPRSETRALLEVCS